jgi:hypothetical protein
VFNVFYIYITMNVNIAFVKNGRSILLSLFAGRDLSRSGGGTVRCSSYTSFDSLSHLQFHQQQKKIRICIQYMKRWFDMKSSIEYCMTVDAHAGMYLLHGGRPPGTASPCMYVYVRIY